MNLIFISNPWSDGEKNPTSKHHLARELNKLGHRVIWVDATGMRVPSIFRFQDWVRSWRKIRSQRTEVRGQRSEVRDQHSACAKVSAGRQASSIEHSPSRPEAVLAPLVLPFPGSKLARKINAGVYQRAIKKAMTAGGIEGAVLVSFLPITPELLEMWSGRTVYYCVDRWDSFDRYDSKLMARLDEASSRNADVVIASSHYLYERCKGYNANAHLISHGVDYEHFSSAFCFGKSVHRSSGSRRRGELNHGGAHEPELGEYGSGQASARRRGCDNSSVIGMPNRLSQHCNGEGAEGERLTESLLQKAGNDEQGTGHAYEPAAPVIGFIGLISEWVDQELLVKVARACPEATVRLIGKYDVDVSRLKAESNIEMLGPRPYSELPAMVADFTVGMIPFVVNDLTRAVNPIKLREMISAGCPVVSTKLPEVQAVAEAMEELNHGVTESRRREMNESEYHRNGGLIRSSLHDEISENNGVVVAGSRKEFVEAVKKLVAKPLTLEQKQGLSESMRSSAWEYKAKEFLGALGV